MYYYYYYFYYTAVTTTSTTTVANTNVQPQVQLVKSRPFTTFTAYIPQETSVVVSIGKENRSRKAGRLKDVFLTIFLIRKRSIDYFILHF